MAPTWAGPGLVFIIIHVQINNEVVWNWYSCIDFKSSLELEEILVVRGHNCLLSSNRNHYHRRRQLATVSNDKTKK